MKIEAENMKEQVANAQEESLCRRSMLYASTGLEEFISAE